MWPPVPVTVAEKLGWMYKIGWAAVLFASACASGSRARLCKAGKPAGNVFEIVNSTVAPDVTLLVTPSIERPPEKFGATNGNVSVPVVAIGTVVVTLKGTAAFGVAAVGMPSGVETFPPRPHAATATPVISNAKDNRA